MTENKIVRDVRVGLLIDKRQLHNGYTTVTRRQHDGYNESSLDTSTSKLNPDAPKTYKRINY